MSGDMVEEEVGGVDGSNKHRTLNLVEKGLCPTWNLLIYAML